MENNTSQFEVLKMEVIEIVTEFPAFQCLTFFDFEFLPALMLRCFNSLQRPVINLAMSDGLLFPPMDQYSKNNRYINNNSATPLLFVLQGIPRRSKYVQLYFRKPNQ